MKFGKQLLRHFSHDIGIDLGTSSTLVYVKQKGITISEPSVVAINTRNDQIVAVGADAKSMLGKSPKHIEIIRPLVSGVVSDFEVTEKMLKYFIDKVHQESFTLLPRPRIIIGIPLEITEVERKAVMDAAVSAGASEVFLVEEPMASAIGARMPVQESVASMIVDMGGGTTNIAVFSLLGAVTWKSIRLAGDELNRNIVNYIREQFNLLIGERTAESIKIAIGTATPIPANEKLEMNVRGRDLLTGLPKEMVINDMQVREAMMRSIRLIIDNIKTVIENTPPELTADIHQRGIVLSGGGALLKGFDTLIAQETNIPVHVVDDPLTAVVRGTGILIENEDLLKNVIINETQPSI
ncbi:MAG: rod shape-determining protein [Patescibacteria group bacterium]